MDMMQANRDRYDQTTLVLERARSQFETWMWVRQNDDRQNFHASQLQDIQALFGGVTRQLGVNLARLDLTRSADAVFADCRMYDTAIARLYRAWDVVRGRFDQRDGDERRNTILKAADEVAWSCYRQVFVLATKRNSSYTPTPPPLVCFDPLWVPEVSQRQDLPAVARIEATDDIKDLSAYLDALPITLIRVPPWCVDLPWQLVFIAHEVGHVIYNQLRLGARLRDRFANAAIDANEAALQDKWRGWCEEVVADLFSVLTMGEWALWGLVEVIGGPSTTMTNADSSRYPPAVVRLALMARALEWLGIDHTAALRGLDIQAIIDSSALAKRHNLVANKVVEVALGDVGDGLGTLRELCETDAPTGPTHPREAQQAAQIAANLLRGETPRLIRSLAATRQSMRGAVRAWASLRDIGDTAKRLETRSALAEAIAKVLVESAGPGRRGTSQSAMGALGVDMARHLLGITNDGVE